MGGGGYKTNELSVALIAPPRVRAFATTGTRGRVLMFTVMLVRRRWRRFPLPLPAGESLCSGCAQIDQVAVTCNESLALSIMSALLDKSSHFQRIGPIASNTARENKSKSGGSGGGVGGVWRRRRKPSPSRIRELPGAAVPSDGLRRISIFISASRAKWIIYWSDNHRASPPIPLLCRLRPVTGREMTPPPSASCAGARRRTWTGLRGQPPLMPPSPLRNLKRDAWRLIQRWQRNV